MNIARNLSCSWFWVWLLVSKVIPDWKGKGFKSDTIWKGKGCESNTSLKRQGFRKWYQSEKARVSKVIAVWKGKGFESDSSLKRQGFRKWYQSEKARVSKVIPVWKGKSFKSDTSLKRQEFQKLYQSEKARVSKVFWMNQFCTSIFIRWTYQQNVYISFTGCFAHGTENFFRVVSIYICSCEALLSISPFEIW